MAALHMAALHMAALHMAALHMAALLMAAACHAQGLRMTVLLYHHRHITYSIDFKANLFLLISFNLLYLFHFHFIFKN